MKILLPALAVAGVALSAVAEETRQHGAHEHGAASLTLASEGRELVIALDSPAYNLFGFEHRPSTDAQHAVMDEALASLRQGADLFRFSAAAGCAAEDRHVQVGMLSEPEEHHDDHGHDEHAESHGEPDDHGHDEEHDEHDDHGHDSDHHDHDEEAGHENGSTGGHSDVMVEWHFECDNPGALREIGVELFDRFPNLTDLDAQYVTDAGQGATELSPDRRTLRF